MSIVGTIISLLQITVMFIALQHDTDDIIRGLCLVVLMIVSYVDGIRYGRKIDD